MEKRAIQLVGQRIFECLEQKTCGEPPCPFVLGGTIMNDLDLSKGEFFMGMAFLIEHNRVASVTEGKKRYYYITGIVDRYREWRDNALRQP